MSPPRQFVPGWLIRATFASFTILGLALISQVVLHVNATTIGFVYLITVLLIAASWGLGQAIAASVIATACFNYFFLPPIHTWTIADPENWVALFALLGSSLVASELSNRAKRRTMEATDRRLEMERLYALSQTLMVLEAQQLTVRQIAEKVGSIYEVPVVGIYHAPTKETFTTNDSDVLAHAIQGNVDRSCVRVFDGHSVTISPLVLAGCTVGSFAMAAARLSDTALDALRNLIAISLESARSREISTRAEAERQSEQFKSTLLDGLAHEFKTPLTSIKAVTTALLTGTVSNSVSFRQACVNPDGGGCYGSL